MVRESLLEMMQDALDRGLAGAPPAGLRDAISSDEEARALWEELCALESELPAALSLQDSIPAPRLREGVMSAIAETQSLRSASVVAIAPARAAMPMSAVAAALLVLALSSAMFLFDRGEVAERVEPGFNRVVAALPAADVAMGPAALAKFELPSLRFSAPMQHSRASIAETGRGIEGTVRIIFRQTAGVVAVFGEAPGNFMRGPATPVP